MTVTNEIATLPAPPAPARIWGFWGTGLWTAAAVAAWVAAQFGALILVAIWRGHADDIDIDDAAIVIATILISTPVQVAVIALAVRLARTSLRDYLALYRFGWRDFGLGIIVLLALSLINDSALYLLGRDIVPQVMIKWYVSARDGGMIVPMVIAIALFAPVAEEIMFRGFIYRGWTRSWLGVSGTVLVTATAWSLLHVQYDWEQLLLIFAIGLLFGWLRWRSGSTSLTILLHVIVNLAAFIQTAIKVEYFS